MSIFPLEECNDLLVNLTSWPIISGRSDREKMYVDPGLKGISRAKLNVETVLIPA